MSYLLEDMEKWAAEEDEDRKKEKRRNIVGGMGSVIGLGVGVDQLRRSGKHKAIAKDFIQKAQEATTHAENSRTKAQWSKSLAEALDSEIVKANQRQSGATKLEDVLNASSKVQNSKAQVDWLKNKYDYASKATATLANRTDINAKRWTPGRHMNHYQENLKLLGRELNEMTRDSAYSPSDLADQRRDIKKTTQRFKEIHDQHPNALKNHPHDKKYWYNASNKTDQWKDKEKAYLRDLEAAQDKHRNVENQYKDLTEKYKKNPYDPNVALLLRDKKERHEADQAAHISNAEALDRDIEHYSKNSKDSTRKSKRHLIGAGLGLAVPAAFAGYKLKQHYDRKKLQRSDVEEN